MILATGTEYIGLSAAQDCPDDLGDAGQIRTLDWNTGATTLVSDPATLPCAAFRDDASEDLGPVATGSRPDEAWPTFEPGATLWTTPSGKLGIVAIGPQAYQIARMPRP